jgi:hypothetical protein
MATTEGIGGFVSVSAAAPSTYDTTATTGYPSLTWTEVGEVTEIPEHGPEHAEVTHTPLKTGIVDKYHGELNYGSIALPMALDKVDAGQTILRDALASKDPISVRLTYSDGSVEYTTGKVFSFKRAASVGSVVPVTAMVGFTKPTVDA